MKFSMSTWMRAEVPLSPLVPQAEPTPQPTLILRIPAAASLRPTSTPPDAMSFVLLPPLDLLCLLTEAAQHPQGRRTEPETICQLGHSLRIQARHCHWGKPHLHSATPGLLPNCSTVSPPFSDSVQEDVPRTVP